MQGNTLVIEARLNVNLTSLTIEQEVAKMKSSHTKMLDLIIDDLKHAGAPPWSLVTLESLRSAAEHRDAAEFNRGAHYRESTTQALDVQQEVRCCCRHRHHASTSALPITSTLTTTSQVFKMLGDEANTEQWLSHETLPEARAKAMRRVAELCARAGEKIYAVQLLRRAADQQNESRAKQISRWQGAGTVDVDYEGQDDAGGARAAAGSTRRRRR